jgi:acetyl-CoA/propionyl-CoA carboxylase biotin carboxyl carrier protein
MIAKLIVHDVDRESARRRMIRALDEYLVEGPVTLIPFHRWLFEHEEFARGGACHSLLAELSERPTPIPAPAGAAGVPPAATDGAVPAATVERRMVAEVDGRRFDVRLFVPEGDARAAARRPARRARPANRPAGAAAPAAAGDSVRSPMQGTVLRLLVAVGQEIAAGDVIVIVEAMKMENEVASHRSGAVKAINVSEGQAVQADEVLAVLEPAGEDAA